ncbi:hypothetical protein [Herbidospora sp. NBRC 101105]|uniref:hypothetical protein n=1 Tax=Herbidospora sp. NBRC 101105 TaxID=3032195 RepID=UPI0024A0BC00|nr:hypothetical protein [Herbidospora sp. NBRC 101105]GLX98720.1 hypothetical protein Hesp01_66700 [Herbidospora sp. NBRC 101105]
MLSTRESASVTSTAKYSEPRTFPVTTEVHPAGKSLMEAHIKLRAVGFPARGGTSGNIWIGYLGDRLPTERPL